MSKSIIGFVFFLCMLSAVYTTEVMAQGYANPACDPSLPGSGCGGDYSSSRGGGNQQYNPAVQRQLQRAQDIINQNEAFKAAVDRATETILKSINDHEGDNLDESD